MTRTLAAFALFGLFLVCGCSPSADSRATRLGPAVTETPPVEVMPPASEVPGGAQTSQPSTAMPPAAAQPAPTADPHGIVLGDLRMTVPESWVRKQPTSGMIQDEFSVPPAKGDQQSGRVTVMEVGGGIEANIDRWKGQFTQPDGSPTKDAKVEKLSAAGLEITLVDISGTFTESGGMLMQAGAKRPDYRMLAAIIPGPQNDHFFIKFTGPKKTVAENEKAFREMLQGLKKA